MSRDLSTAQVAERFGVTPANVRVWCRRGLLAGAYELEESRGPVWMIPESALAGFEPPKKTGRPPKPKGGGSKPKHAKKGGKK